jgi:transporter family protein
MQFIFLTIVLYASWGLGDIFAKLAANRIGSKALFWHYLAYVIGISLYSLYVYRKDSLWQADLRGILLAVLAGVVSVAGAVSMYKMLSLYDVSVVSAAKSLSIALVTILAIVLLKEKITVEKITGITLAIFSIYLLNR